LVLTFIVVVVVIIIIITIVKFLTDCEHADIGVLIPGAFVREPRENKWCHRETTMCDIALF
jgi:hypothetical protein